MIVWLDVVAVSVCEAVATPSLVGLGVKGSVAVDVTVSLLVVSVAIVFVLAVGVACAESLLEVASLLVLLMPMLSEDVMDGWVGEGIPEELAFVGVASLEVEDAAG